MVIYRDKNYISLFENVERNNFFIDNEMIDFNLRGRNSRIFTDGGISSEYINIL